MMDGETLRLNPVIERLAHTLPRLVLGAVLAYFGAAELVLPASWTGYLPTFVPSNIALWFIVLHGFVLFVAGALIAVGFGLRLVRWIGVLLMATVAADLVVTSGVSAIWIRDLGVTALSLALALQPERGFSLDEASRAGMPVQTL